MLRSLSVALALSGLALVPSPAEAAGAPTCQGLPATLVGSLNSAVTGTEGPDVIVTNGARDVRSLGGDDRICVTSDDGRVPAPERGTGFPPQVFAGAGDDDVRVPVDPDGAYSAYLRIDLGSGADRFGGSPGQDFVSTDQPLSGDTGAGGPDRVTAGRGDRVNLDGDVIDDVVRANDGATVIVETVQTMTDGAELVGDGTARLNIGERRGSPQGWTIDNQAGALRLNGEQRLTWSGFRRFSWYSNSYDNAVRFLGSAAAEWFESATFSRADMGGGADVVETGRWPQNDLPGQPRTITGGTGIDHLIVEKFPTYGALAVDAVAGQVRLGPNVPPIEIAGLESYRLRSSTTISFSGSRVAERVVTETCGEVRVFGAGGNDVLTELRNPDIDNCDTRYDMRIRPIRLDGGAGNDRITGATHHRRYSGAGGLYRGSAGNDVIVGGSGVDTADGGPGRDSCRAEREWGCER